LLTRDGIMKITQSQAMNIVRTYNKQLRVGSMGQAEAGAPQDKVSLSAEAKRLGNGVPTPLAADKPAPNASQSVETQVKSHTDFTVQRNLPFD